MMLVSRSLVLLLVATSPCLAAWHQFEDSRMYHQEASYTLVKTRNYEHELHVLSEIIKESELLRKNKLPTSEMVQLRNAKVDRVLARARIHKARLESLKRRYRRGIADWFGSGIKWAFGNPDANDFKNLKASIDAAVKAEKKEEKAIHKMINSTETNAANIKQLASISSMVSAQNNKTLRELKSEEARAQTMMEISTILAHKNTLIDAVQWEIDKFEKITDDARKGYLSKYMIDAEELADALKAAPESGLTPIWPDAQRGNYYWQKGMARSALHGLEIVTILEIPLIDRSSNLTMHYSPLNDGEMLAIDADNSNYRYLGKHDLNRCHYLVTAETLCTGRKIEMHSATSTICLQPTSCVTGLKLPYNKITEVANNVFKVRLDDEYTVTVSCKAASDDNASKREIVVKKNGQYEFDPICKISCSEFTLSRGRKAGRRKNAKAATWVPDHESAYLHERMAKQLRVASASAKKIESAFNHLNSSIHDEEDGLKAAHDAINEVDESVAAAEDKYQNLEEENTAHFYAIAGSSGSILVVAAVVAGTALYFCKKNKTIKVKHEQYSRNNDRQTRELLENLSCIDSSIRQLRGAAAAAREREQEQESSV